MISFVYLVVDVEYGVCRSEFIEIFEFIEGIKYNNVRVIFKLYGCFIFFR